MELSEARSMSVGCGTELTHLPGPACLVALVPDENPNREPAFRVYSPDERVVPYEIMSWFMEQVVDQGERCRVAFEQKNPETAQ
ncbi:hypothetical protein [Streptomyces sp. NPDC012825]|uniref:hypothetical protein n=1 Tax=Streptomyces sp. NPDC012825 TaxID=3364851 RepID=UPI00368A3BE2